MKPTQTAQFVHPQFIMPQGAKSRVTYVLLGLFFGAFGIHNFYANRNGAGVAQLLLTVLSFGMLGLISIVWAFIEVLAVTVDGRGNRMF